MGRGSITRDLQEDRTGDTGRGMTVRSLKDSSRSKTDSPGKIQIKRDNIIKDQSI